MRTSAQSKLLKRTIESLPSLSLSDLGSLIVIASSLHTQRQKAQKDTLNVRQMMEQVKAKEPVR